MKLEAKDLRIGNYVKMGDYGIDTLNAYNIYQLELLTNGGIVANFYKFIEPIPLTVEWLEKFGFEEDRSVLDPIDTPNGNFWSDWVLDDFIICMPFYSLFWGDNETEVKHVHQLQNLYHALTGKELTIKK